MKKSNSLSLLMTIGGLVVIIACVLFLVLQKISLERKLSQAVVVLQHERSKNVVLQSNVVLSMQSSGKLIDNKIQLVGVSGKKYTVSEIFAGETPILIFRFSLQGCSPCIGAAFGYLRRLAEEVNPNKLRTVIIIQDITLREMLIASLQRENSQFTFYLADETGLGLPIDNEFVSYLAIVYRYKTSNVFVVDRMFLPLLERYINTLIEIYK